MKTFKTITFIFFIFVCTKTKAQELKLEQMKRLTGTSSQFSDILIQLDKYKRVNVEWLENGFLVTQYRSSDSKTLVEVGSSTIFIYCVVFTKDKNYVNALIAEAYSDDFIKEKDLMQVNNNLPVLKKGKQTFGVSKNQKTELYKISLNRDF